MPFQWETVSAFEKGGVKVDQKAWLDYVNQQQEMVLQAEREIWAHPETGFREWNTAAYLRTKLEAMGYQVRTGGDIPALSAQWDSGRPGPCVCILGEMDALTVPGHPEADPATGAAHACGHNAQSAALLGTAAVFAQIGQKTDLRGSIRFIAVPAEEMIEVAYRHSLKKSGTIGFWTGKPELMRRGFFDGVDAAVLCHASSKPQKQSIAVYPGNNGCLMKTARFLGRSAHAGGAPHLGINALNAALLALNGIQALRETFREQDYVRVNAILKEGGQAAGVIPGQAEMEIMLRASSLEVLTQINQKVTRALGAGAACVGAELTVEDIFAYPPFENNPVLNDLVLACAKEIPQVKDIIDSSAWDTGSTDLGSLAACMPVCHIYVGGASGSSHGESYCITHPRDLCMNAVALYTLLAVRLLAQDSQLVWQEMKSGHQFHSISQQIANLSSFDRCFSVVHYGETGSVTIKG